MREPWWPQCRLLRAQIVVGHENVKPDVLAEISSADGCSRIPAGEKRWHTFSIVASVTFSAMSISNHLNSNTFSQKVFSIGTAKGTREQRGPFPALADWCSAAKSQVIKWKWECYSKTPLHVGVITLQAFLVIQHLEGQEILLLVSENPKSPNSLS